MQKLINVIALLSGLTSLTLIAGSSYVLLNKDALIENAKVKITEAVTGAVTDTVTKSATGAALNSVKSQVPALVKSNLPVMPNTTGAVLDFEKGFTKP